MLTLTCFLFSSSSIHQSVHVGAAGEHPQTLHLPVGGVHRLLRAAVQTDGFHDG